jgi:hypothetical protein
VPLTKLQFKPGIVRETTSYTNEGGWYDCDKVRFRYGLPEKIGGWEKYSTTQYLGSARSLHAWNALDGSKYLALAQTSSSILKRVADITTLPQFAQPLRQGMSPLQQWTVQQQSLSATRHTVQSRVILLLFLGQSVLAVKSLQLFKSGISNHHNH